MNSATRAYLRRAAAIGSLIALAGMTASCKTTGAGAVPPGTPDFRTGYTDGCTSGYGDAGRRGMEDVFVKDESRFDSDAQYKDGWLQGYAACYRSEREQPMLGIR